MRITKTCPQCQKEFEVIPSENDRTFCSRACYLASVANEQASGHKQTWPWVEFGAGAFYFGAEFDRDEFFDLAEKKMDFSLIPILRELRAWPRWVFKAFSAKPFNPGHFSEVVLALERIREIRSHSRDKGIFNID